VQLDGRIPREVLKQMLEASYGLVVDSLPAAQRRALTGAGSRR
jgi:predicted DNA-binding protein (MmcQ/YjbR family)